MLIFLSMNACDGIFPAQSKPDVPEDHQQNISGFLHKDGLFEPLDTAQGCMTASCHGNDLRGGAAFAAGRQITVPSCYECHGALWEGGGEDDHGREHDDD